MRLRTWSVALLAVASLAALTASPTLANGKGRGGGRGGGGGGHWRPPNNCRPNNPPPRRNVRRNSYTNWNLGLGLGFGDGFYGGFGGYGLGYYGGSTQWVPDYGRFYSSGPIIQSCGCQSGYHYTNCNQYTTPAVREYHYRTVYQPIYQPSPATTNTNVDVRVRVNTRTTTRRSYVVEEDESDDDDYDDQEDVEDEEYNDEDEDPCRHKRHCSKNQQCSYRRSNRDTRGDGYWSNRLRDRRRGTN